MKYKKSLVLGKFFPAHKGHLFLIDSALKESEVVHVMACWNHEQTIPGKIRADALRKIYHKNPNVRIHSVYDGGLPQYEHEVESKDIFYSYWTRLVDDFVCDLDAIFTAESYGDDFAKYLGEYTNRNIIHELVDIDRTKYPISGTEIRENPHKHWDMIPDAMKGYFIKRVAIMRPESVGKSILSEKLAKHFDTNFVEEYGRTVFEENGNKLELSDFIKISLGRQDLEEELIIKSNKVIFCDTEDLTTYFFLQMFFPDSYKRIEEFFTSRLRRDTKYDLYILLKPDVEFIQDGTRKFEKERQEHYENIKHELDFRMMNYIEVGGNWDERLQKSIELVSVIL